MSSYLHYLASQTFQIIWLQELIGTKQFKESLVSLFLKTEIQDQHQQNNL